MRTRISFRFRPWQAVLGLLLVAVLVWSSWEEPSLHDYAPPTEFLTLAAPTLQPGPAAKQLQARAAALPGVTACALRADKQLLTLAFNPEQLTAEEVCRRLALKPLPLAAPAPNARQCPVPAGYIVALERLRFALNLRRLFVIV
ncbi:hypothetical protein [Hymenobacter metallicola]|uniref:Heavy-metal-associated domain-containing protein n=1 Tax=Hymenobacter metallicola TaxID=2563114 RepID=A0A4Z0PXJ7_9BACT|nr:hypothetical protein [Hymenobacter metallicola]TGE21152.1 hypothetical protein E5K02_24380 [Hymenobacter metallicola]